MNEITIADMKTMSEAFAKSGFFGYKKPEDAFTLMCIAQSNGLHPAKACERYHIINGRPAMKAESMLASFQEAGGSIRWICSDDKQAKLYLKHPQAGEIEIEWTIERAKKAGLTNKSTWVQYPAQMLRARCVSEGVRALYPACLNGMYEVSEVQDFTTPLIDNESGKNVSRPDPRKEVQMPEITTETPTKPPRKMKAEEVEERTPINSLSSRQRFTERLVEMKKEDPAAYEMLRDWMHAKYWNKISDVPAEAYEEIEDTFKQFLSVEKTQNGGTDE